LNNISTIKVKIVSSDGGIIGELNRVFAPHTVETIANNLPLEGPATYSRNQICFKVKLKLGVEKPRREVEAGAICYWPLGESICLFLADSKTYSPVNVIGTVGSEISSLSKRRAGSIIRMERFREGE